MASATGCAAIPSYSTVVASSLTRVSSIVGGRLGRARRPTATLIRRGFTSVRPSNARTVSPCRCAPSPTRNRASANWALQVVSVPPLRDFSATTSAIPHELGGGLDFGHREHERPPSSREGGRPTVCARGDLNPHVRKDTGT